MDYKHLDKLLNKIKGNDDKAFEELYQAYYKRVFYFALQLSKNQQDAQDIAQDTFIQLKKSIKNLQDNRAFSVWLHRIVISKAGGLFRRNKTITISDDHVTFKQAKEERDYMLPNETMHFHSDQAMLEYFLNDLDEKYRVVLVLSYFSNFKIKEIAEILDVPEGTVKSRMSTGKEQLRHKIECYQEQEGIRLDFKTHDLTGELISFFALKAGGMAISTATSIPFVKGIKLIGKQISTQMATVSAIAVVSSVAVFGVYQYQENKKNEEVITQNTINTTDKDFPHITYKNKVYKDVETAFYELTLWAHCEEEMKKYTESEYNEIKVLYDAVKAQNGVYWGMLKARKWNTSFESFENKLLKQ